MNRTQRIASHIAIALVASLGLTGCGESDHDDTGPGHSHDGHDHAHDHAGHDHDHGDDHHSHDHASQRSLGSVTIAGTTLSVSASGEIEPSALLHLDITRKDGPMPAAIRVWIGDESGTGALKAKATGSDGDYHVHADVPAKLTPEAALWIEVETLEGDRQSASVPLEGRV